MKRVSNVSCIAAVVAGKILSGLDTAVAREAGRLLKEDPGAYLALSINPEDYADAASFGDDYLAVELMSKFDKLDVNIDRQAVAIRSFLEAEEQCRLASLRLRDLRKGNISIMSPHHWILHSAREKIRKALRPFSWDAASRYFSFGPGASIGIPRRKSDGYYKYGHLRPSVTQACSALAVACISRNQEWFSHLSNFNGPDLLSSLTYSEGNRVTTVPKNAKTDRIIAIEPQMNMYVQKGIGGLIRRRLLGVGIDLSSQELNQQLAEEGSRLGELATIDLSAASDSISLALVEDLLPSDWFEAIKASRSPVGILPDGRKITYQKVSSMGNGFTFELETLIFWSLASSVLEFRHVSDRRLAVYGDDIVVHRDAVDQLRATLEFVGFKFNDKKSFWSGPFRESCGKHYFAGTDVTPFYIRKAVDDIERILWCINSIKVQAHRMVGLGYGCDSRLLGAWQLCYSKLPVSIRHLRGPLWLQGQMLTTCVGTDFDEFCPRPAPNGYAGWSFREYKRVYGTTMRFDHISFIRWMDTVGSKSSRVVPVSIGGIASQPDPLRLMGGVSNVEYQTQRYKLRTVKSVAPQWAGAGPWI